MKLKEIRVWSISFNLNRHKAKPILNICLQLVDLLSCQIISVVIFPGFRQIFSHLHSQNQAHNCHIMFRREKVLSSSSPVFSCSKLLWNMVMCLLLLMVVKAIQYSCVCICLRTCLFVFVWAYHFFLCVYVCQYESVCRDVCIFRHLLANSIKLEYTDFTHTTGMSATVSSDSRFYNVH